MRVRQTARKSTARARPLLDQREALSRHFQAHERHLDGLARVNDLDGINNAIQNGDLARFVNDENQVNPVVVLPYIREVPRVSPDHNYRATTGRNGRLVPQFRTRQMARKYTGPDPPRFRHPPAAPVVSSTTEPRSKQVRKHPEDEVSPGGTRRPKASNSQQQQPSSSTQDANQMDAADDSEAEPRPSTSSGAARTTRSSARATRRLDEAGLGQSSSKEKKEE